MQSPIYSKEQGRRVIKVVPDREENVNEELVERHQLGLNSLRALLLGNHLRPRELALMVAAFVAEPGKAQDIINESEVNDGGQAT